ncbi:MAG: hypothetical protein RG741_01610 [Bacteroidales bacterium]|nr:hypothetical protein [Bacteroidales bacterium]
MHVLQHKGFAHAIEGVKAPGRTHVPGFFARHIIRGKIVAGDKAWVAGRLLAGCLILNN